GPTSSRTGAPGADLRPGHVGPCPNSPQTGPTALAPGAVGIGVQPSRNEESTCRKLLSVFGLDQHLPAGGPPRLGSFGNAPGRLPTRSLEKTPPLHPTGLPVGADRDRGGVGRAKPSSSRVETARSWSSP